SLHDALPIFPFDAPILERRKIVTCCPGTRREFLAEQIVFRREAFETDFAITIVLKANRIEITLPTRNRKIGAPPILDPLKFNEVPDLEAADLVSAAAERNIERRF